MWLIYIHTYIYILALGEWARVVHDLLLLMSSVKLTHALFVRELLMVLLSFWGLLGSFKTQWACLLRVSLVESKLLQHSWGESLMSWRSHRGLGPESRGTYSRTIRAISAVESMEVGTYHFAQVPSPTSPSMTYMDVYMTTLFGGGQGLGLGWGLGRAKSWTQHSTQVPGTCLEIPIWSWQITIFEWIIEAPKVGTLPPRWDLLTCMRLGTRDPLWTGTD